MGIFARIKSSAVSCVTAIKEKVSSCALAVSSVAVAAVSSSAFASEETDAALTAAVASGKTSYTLIVVGVIGIAAVGFCLGLIVSKLRN